MWCVNDLYSNEELISYNEWKRRGAENKDYMLWRGIIHAIPKAWKILLQLNENVNDIIEKCGINLNDVYVKIDDICDKTVKQWLTSNIFKHMKAKDFKAKQKYSKSYTNITDETWNRICMLPHMILQDNKVIEMQFKIIHRIIGNNRLLYKIGKSRSPNCDLCHMYVEDIEHIFYNCMIAKNFWFDVLTRWNTFTGENVKINAQNILLGLVFDQEEICKALNMLILYGKKFIYTCKMNVCTPTFEQFKIYIKSCIEVLSITDNKLKHEYEVLHEFLM